MHRFAVILVSACLFGQGDAPYLRESGWQPLLNGSDLKGWHGMEPAKPHEWFTTKGVEYGEKTLGGKKEPGGRIVNGATGKTQNWITGRKFGDLELYIEWMVAKGSNSGVYLQGLYEVQVFDSWGKPEVNYSDAGGIYHRWINNQGVGGSPPRVNASRPPGEWNWYRIWFRAPRFDASGRKIENAKFLKVMFNGQLVQENVEVDGGTRSHLPIAEAAENPLMLQGDHGPVAYRNIYRRPLQ